MIISGGAAPHPKLQAVTHVKGDKRGDNVLRERLQKEKREKEINRSKKIKYLLLRVLRKWAESQNEKAAALQGGAEPTVTKWERGLSPQEW